MIMAAWVMSPVAAVHPKSGGNAPGKAPTNTATRTHSLQWSVYKAIKYH